MALNAARRHGVAKVVLTCYRSNGVSADGQYVYRLPCIGAVGAEWVLEAGAMVGEVELRCPDPKCPVGGAGPALSAAKEAAEAFGASVEEGEGSVKIRAKWGVEIGALSGTRRRDYSELLKGLRRHYSGGRAPLKMYKVEVDPNRCTLCGVCFAKCPERAFDVGRDGDAVKLYLNTAKCVGCGYCAAVCPEKAIAVSKADALLPEAEEKAVDYVVRCKSCGRAFDTLKHVQAVKAKLGIKGDPEWLYLCPECRRYYTAKKMLESALGKRG
jgi:ferredoxin